MAILQAPSNAILHDAVDTIQDFEVGADLIDLRASLSTVPTVDQFGQFIKLTQVGANTELSINADGMGSDFAALAVLFGTNANNLNPTSFVIA
ncbi:MAG: hypothetical protein Kow00121_26490 [Elainellaceae cyanobacterium]